MQDPVDLHAWRGVAEATAAEFASSLLRRILAGPMHYGLSLLFGVGSFVCPMNVESGEVPTVCFCPYVQCGVSARQKQISTSECVLPIALQCFEIWCH